MIAAVLSFQPIYHFSPSFPFNKKLKLRMPVSSLSEIADKHTPLSSLQVTVSSIAADGNRASRPRKSSTSGRQKGDESGKKSTDAIKAPNSSSQEEIIALFRRIQSSISKGETANAKTQTLGSSKDSGNNVQDTRTKKGGKALRWKSGVRKKRQMTGKRAAAAIQDFKLSRPPSNFVKRSPIPYPTPYRGKNLEQNDEVVANVEKMKLPELKELAKAKGIKGYSRLKKSELVQLLSS